ncbi:MAG: UDP-glucose 4-epimerase GalE [Flavobacteriales bacterium]|nr:UDP-glucose 4-epimerase GalE [Flavobacteriales bacterium]
MIKILVTGGAGFIGSHTVVELVNGGFQPVIVDNFCNSHRSVIGNLEEITKQQLIVYDVDCTDELAMRQIVTEHPDLQGAIHFAAYKAVGESVRFPHKYYHNNINSLLVLTRVMDAFGIRNLVFSSSCTVYGQPDQLPVSEETPYQLAESPYGYTKQICERILQDLVRGEGNTISSVLLRYFNPIGAHPSGLIGELPLGVPENLIPYITQTAAGLREQLTVFGTDYSTPDGTCVRDYIHVVDLAKAHVKALQWMADRPVGCESFNLGTGRGNSVLEVLHTFEEVSGEKLNYVLGDRRPGDVEQIYASSEKANQTLGWKTELHLADALKDAWNWQLKLETHTSSK